jgi:hypothetical protein
MVVEHCKVRRSQQVCTGGGVAHVSVANMIGAYSWWVGDGWVGGWFSVWWCVSRELLILPSCWSAKHSQPSAKTRLPVWVAVAAVLASCWNRIRVGNSNGSAAYMAVAVHVCACLSIPMA